MKLSKKQISLFQPEIDHAIKAGKKFWAKSVCCQIMRFGETEDQARKKASSDARRLARQAGCPDAPPIVQFGSL